MGQKPIIEVKPRWGPLTFNLNELWRRLRGKPSGNVEIVASRVLSIFEAHGVAPPQIPKFIPAIKLSSLNTTESILPALTPQVLNEIAGLFKIQRAWLEGTTDRIYDTHLCYKQPSLLFDLLGRIQYKMYSCPVRVLTSVKSLDCRDDNEQPLALVLVEKLADNEDVDQIWDIDRYHIFCDKWNWAYLPSRIQLKAMVRVIDQVINERVPLYHVSSQQLDAVLEGRLVPRPLVNRGLNTDPSLEDYACSREEHAQAKETAELSNVKEYTRSNDLENIAQSVIKRVV